MEYSIKPKRLGERRIIHYPQKRIIGLYVIDVDSLKLNPVQKAAFSFNSARPSIYLYSYKIYKSARI